MLRLICLALCCFLSLPIYAAETTFSSKAFAENVPLPTLYTCDGKDISPDLAWTNLPAKTQTVAVIFSDEDVPEGRFYHWIVYNIPKNIQELSEAVELLPSQGTVGKNSWGKTQYNGPCPPKGTLHHYTFTLYALDKKLELPADIDGLTLVRAMIGHVLKVVELRTAYGRWLT